MKYVKSASEPQLVGSQPRIIVLIIDYEDECDFDDVDPSGQAGQSTWHKLSRQQQLQPLNTSGIKKWDDIW